MCLSGDGSHLFDPSFPGHYSAEAQPTTLAVMFARGTSITGYNYNIAQQGFDVRCKHESLDRASPTLYEGFLSQKSGARRR